MPEFVRVRDKDTGHEYSVVHVKDNHEVLEKKNPLNARGKPYPAKHKTSVAKKAAASKSSKSSTSSGDEPTETTPKEGS
jgi:hypothetical protein